MCALAAAALALALPACGSDDDEPRGKTGAAAPEATSTAPETAPPPDAGEPTAPEDGGGGAPAPGGDAPSPEDAPGGAGDEEPARVEVELHARGGRLTPRRAEVPSYISVWVILISDDGRPHSVSVDGRRVAVDGRRRRGRLVLDGLRPQARYTVRPEGGGPAATIAAVAEPGP